MENPHNRAVSILAFPIVLTLGILLIPVVTDYTDHQLAEQGVAQVGRWFSGHLIAALGFALANPAVGAIGETLERRSAPLPRLTRWLIALGSGLYAAGLGADGIGPLAVRSAGASPVMFFDGSGYWVTGTFVLGTVVFGLGLLMTVGGAINGGLLRGWVRYFCIACAFLFMALPMILSGWALYGVGAATFGVCLPIASAIWRGD